MFHFIIGFVIGFGLGVALLGYYLSHKLDTFKY